MDEFEDQLEAAYWEFDARVKGYNEWKLHPQSERDAFKQVVRTLKHNPIYINPDMEYLSEEAECAHMILDDLCIPRSNENDKYSLVGRIMCLVTKVPV